MNQTLIRRVVGSSLAILLIALGYLGVDFALAPASGSYQVEAILGTAGSGLYVGTDVKTRGVIIGKVSALRFEKLNGEGPFAIATLLLDPEPPLPTADKINVQVAQKTLLGEKQVELVFEASDFLTGGAALAAGDVLRANRQITELDAVIDELTPLLQAIDPEDLAEIIEALGSFEGEGPIIAENLAVGSELAAFGDRIAEESLERLGQLADVAQDLVLTADEINRLSASIPGGTELLIARQDDIARVLRDTSTFAVTLAEWLEVERETFDRLLDSGDPILALFEDYEAEIGNVVQGFYRYTYKLGHEPGWLTDGTGFAYFRIFVDGQVIAAGICEQAGPLAAAIPICPTPEA